MLQVSGYDDRFVSSFSGQLDPQVPSIQCDKGELEILGYKVLLSKMVKTSHCIAEGAGIADVLPCQGGEAGCDSRVSTNCPVIFSQCLYSLHSGVMGVLTGLTSTLSRYI